MNGYPLDILKKLQATEMEILDAIADVCKKHKIDWFLDGGSLLGAIRHHGFIPWDDDMDIDMLREDYDRFIRIAPQALPSKYELIIPGETANYAAMFAKVCKRGTKFYTQETLDAGFEQGIFVDIFPLDYVWKDKVKALQQYKAARKYTRMSYLYHSAHVSKRFNGLMQYIMPVCFSAAHIILKATTNSTTLFQQFEKRTAICPKEEAAGYTLFSYPYEPVFPTELLVPPIPVSFENRIYFAPAKPEAFLDKEYGESWRELPPEDQRKTHNPIVLDFGDGKNVFAN